MRRTVPALSIVLTGAVVGLAGCGSASNATPPGNGTAEQTASAPASASASPSHPLSYYANQYTKAVAACNADEKAVGALIPNDGASVNKGDKIDLAGQKASKTCEAFDQKIIRMMWPGGVLADIKTLVKADVAVDYDLADLPDLGFKVVSDLALANAASSIVRADLGLPAFN